MPLSAHVRAENPENPLSVQKARQLRGVRGRGRRIPRRGLPAAIQHPLTHPVHRTGLGCAGGGEAAAAAEAAAGAAMAPLFFELAAAWPVGYRLEEKCGALRAYVGDALEGMCTYHGCGRNEAAAL